MTTARISSNRKLPLLAGSLLILGLAGAKGSVAQSGSIVFSSFRDGNQEVYAIDLSTGRQTDLTRQLSDDGYPRYSPDGRKIAFATNRDGYWEIYLMNRDGTSQWNLTKNSGGSGYMDWSPDGQWLVFASTRFGDQNNLCLIRSGGSDFKRLTHSSSEDVHPAWSPDGKKIAFASERDGNRQIYVMSADRLNVRQLMNIQRLTNDRWYDDYPAWSPDGSKIAFASDRDSGSSDRLDIYVMNWDGTNVRRLIGHPADDRHPAWSPDGKMIAFSSNRYRDRDIFIVNADGTGLRRVVSNRGDDEHPHWCLVAASGETEEAKSKIPDRSSPADTIPDSIRSRAAALGLYARGIPMDGFQELLLAVTRPYHMRQIVFTANGWFINEEGIFWKHRGLPIEAISKIKELGSFSGDSITEVAFSPEGGWVVTNQYGNFFANNIPETLLKKLTDIHDNENAFGRRDMVDCVAFAPDGGWLVIFGDLGEGKKIEAKHLPVDAANAIRELMHEKKRIYQVAFSPNGGWVVIFDRNGFRSNGIPKEMLDVLSLLNRTGQRIRRVAFAPNGGWVVYALRE